MADNQTASQTAREFDEESRKRNDKINAMEIELLKKMSPEKLKAQMQLELSMMDKDNPDTPVAYSPNRKYVEKNLKPESIPVGSLYALAAAQKKAEKTGALSPEVAKYMLANALVEGRPNDFGVNENVYPGTSKAVKAVVDKMGVGKETKVPEGFDQYAAYLQAAGKPTPQYKKDDIMLRSQVTEDKGKDVKVNAKMAATMLAIKAAQTTSPEEAIKAWNGRGPGAEAHLEKVKEAHRMLNDPKNAAILSAYQRALKYSDEE